MSWNVHFNQNYFAIYNRLLSEERDFKEAKFLAQFIPSKDAATFGIREFVMPS